MARNIQNKVAESKLTLPVLACYTFAVWNMVGDWTQERWLLLICLGLTTYLMMVMNNVHALLRIYSRMISGAFLALMCCACFPFSSLEDAVMQLCFAAFLLVWFTTYQDKTTAGRTYYAFLLLGIASLTFSQLLYLLPMIWLLSATNIMSMSWRTCTASFLGLLTPYWFEGCWLFYKGDFTPLTEHVSALHEFGPMLQWELLDTPEIMTLGFFILLTITSIVHLLRKYYLDKIRTRMFYGCFCWLNILAITFIILQPQHYRPLMLVSCVCTAPLIGHFLALTTTRMTNIASIAIAILSLAITLYNVWTS